MWTFRSYHFYAVGSGAASLGGGCFFGGLIWGVSGLLICASCDGSHGEEIS